MDNYKPNSFTNISSYIHNLQPIAMHTLYLNPTAFSILAVAVYSVSKINLLGANSH